MTSPGDSSGYRASTQSWQIRDAQETVAFFRSSKTVTFTGAAGAGQIGAVPLFAVTGSVMTWAIVARCTTDLVSAGGGVLALGTPDSTDMFMDHQTITATDLTNGKAWFGNGTALIASGVEMGYASPGAPWLLEDDDAQITVTIANVTGGVLVFDIFWSPFTSGALISAV